MRKSSFYLNSFLAAAFAFSTPLFVFAEETPFKPAAEEASLTLFDCYKLALKQSEKVAIRKEAIREIEGRLFQALSGMFPDVSFSYSLEKQNGTNQNNFTLREIPEAKFTFSQALFSGFKEFAAISSGRAQIREGKEQIRRAKELLFIDVSDAFYFFLNYEQDIEALQVIKKSIEEQLAELSERQKLGRSRASAVASTELRLRRIEAEIELIESNKEVARELLEFLIGRSFSKLQEEEINFSDIGQRENFLAKSEVRADVLAAKAALEARQKEIVVARSGYFPTVGLDGNYYTKRVGNAANVDWDVTFRVDAPIFDGGETGGKIRSARALAKEQELTLREARRSADLQINNAYTKFQLSLKREEALRRAYEAANKNYELQAEDFKHNLVSNLEILQALQDLEEVRREYIAALNQTKQSFWNLKVQAGDIPYGDI